MNCVIRCRTKDKKIQYGCSAVCKKAPKCAAQFKRCVVNRKKCLVARSRKMYCVRWKPKSKKKKGKKGKKGKAKKKKKLLLQMPKSSGNVSINVSVREVVT